MVTRIEDIEAAITTMSDEDLFEALGKSRDDRAHFGAETKEVLVRSGKQYWNKSSALIRGLVCENPEFQSAIKKDVSDIAGFVLLALGAKFAPAVVGYLAVMTVRRILQGWCSTAST